jgi:hypothetical protein
MATKKETPTVIKARILSDCTYGLHGDVIEIDAVIAATCQQLDTDPAAVAYAESVLAELLADKA